MAGTALLAPLASACSTETALTIRAQGENAEGEVVPLTNVTLDVIPYDIDALYEELEASTRPGEPPHADTLGALARQHQEACTAYRATGDSIEAVRQQATQVARYEALVSLERARFDQCESLTDRYTEARDAYREARRAWEDEAWPAEGFSRAESLRIGQRPVQRIQTDESGLASVTVPNGTWWILGTAPVPGSISQRYRWTHRVEAAGGEQTVELTSENAELEPVF